MKNSLLIIILILTFSCKKEKPEVSEIKNNSALIEAYRFSPEAQPIISVHRGGKGLINYPENCLETLQYVNDSIEAIYEIDVARTKDSVLVLLHDNTLDRTTTGTDKLTNYSYAELQQFNLEDDFGNETAFKIPLFKNVLLWAKNNNVVLTIDIKKSVALEEVVDLIRKTKAEDISILITYSLDQTKAAYKLAPDLLLSASARNSEEFNWLLESGIPTENILAFTGTRLSADSLFTNIHNKRIKTILGTLGNLDKQAEARGDHLYNEWVAKGIDVIATDRPFAVAKTLELEK